MYSKTTAKQRGPDCPGPSVVTSPPTFDAMLRDPSEQFDRNSELLPGILSYLSGQERTEEVERLLRSIEAYRNAPLMPDIDIDKLRELAEAATPGPWYREYGDVVTTSDDPRDEDADEPRPARVVRRAEHHGMRDAQAIADAAFIAACSPDVIPTLVAELVGLRTEVDQLRNTFIGDPKCSGCAGGGLVWSGAEYAGTREYVGCPDCEGTGVAPPGLYGTVRSLLSNLWDVWAERDAALAEVDQLRDENEQLGADLQGTDLIGEMMEKATAERDALQAEVEELRRENSVLQHAIDCPPRDVAKQRAIKQVDALQARIDAVVAVVQEQKQRNQGPAAKILDSVWMVRSDLLLAALGVDPQKEGSA